MDLSNCVVVITGGASGLGRAMAWEFSQKKAQVVVCGRDKTALGKASKEIGALAIPMDVTDEKQVLRAAKRVFAKFGRLDIWVNNAGVWMPREPLEKVDMKKARRLMETNVFGTLHGMRAALSFMKPLGRGTVLNIISTTAFDGMNGTSGALYVTSKYALRGLTNAVRDELRGSGVKIIGAYPGGIKTELFREAVPQNFKDFMAVEEVAQKIIANLALSEPETQQLLKRRNQTTSHELSETVQK